MKRSKKVLPSQRMADFAPNSPVFLVIALLYTRHTNEFSIKIISSQLGPDLFDRFLIGTAGVSIRKSPVGGVGSNEHGGAQDGQAEFGAVRNQGIEDETGQDQ